MKSAIFLSALMLASPAAAKTWVDATCELMMESTEAAFIIGRTDGDHVITCDFKSWPLDTPVATLSCDDGTSPEMEPMQDGSMRLEKVMLLPKGDKRVLCD